MNFIEASHKIAEYLTCADVFRKHSEGENKIKYDKTSTTDIIPLEAGLEGSTKIYLLRLKNWPILSATLISRWTGIDLVIRGSQRLFNR